MGKRKDSSRDEGESGLTDSPGSAHKKHKKHKKKHKKRREEYSVVSEPGVSGADKPAIKLKLKIGGETFGTKNVTTIEKIPESDDSTEAIINVDEPWDNPVTEEALPVKTDKDEDNGKDQDKDKEDKEDKEKVKVKDKEKDASDEEQQWLDALEKGELDDYGDVKKVSAKDDSLLTTRQKALLHGKQERELLQLPSGYKAVELTEEQLQRRQQRARKRREQAKEKREKDKKNILDRLLKKQDTKLKGSKGRGRRSDVPNVHYVNNQSRITISVPSGIQFPFPAQTAKPLPPVEKCGVTGCSNSKKYSCSKTGVPLCSLQCYKINLSVRGGPLSVPVT